MGYIVSNLAALHSHLMRRGFVVILLLTTILSSCNTSSDPEVTYYGSQTTLHYFMGTNLKSSFSTNISQHKTAVANGALGKNGRLYYLYPSTTTAATLYEVYYSKGSAETREVQSYFDFPSISQESLAQVIEDVKSDAELVLDDPLHQMNLIIGGHGMAWQLIEDPSSSLDADLLRSSIADYGLTEVQYIDGDVDLTTRYIGLITSSSEGIMDIEDFRSAIEQSGVKFGYLIFDSCFMSNIETLYRLRDCADYIVASPAEVLSWGFPYSTLDFSLFANSGTTFDLESVCEYIYDDYASSSYPYSTIAVCVTAELEPLADILSDMTLREIEDSERSGLQSYERYASHKFYDLEQYVSLVADDSSLFQEQFDRAFPPSCRLYTAKYFSGVTVNDGRNYSYATESSTSQFRPISYYSGVSTSEPSVNLYCYGWSSEPWAIDAGRADQ